MSSSFSSIALRTSDSASSIVATLFMASRRALSGTSIVEASRLIGSVSIFNFLQLVRVDSALSQTQTERLHVNGTSRSTFNTRRVRVLG